MNIPLNTVSAAPAHVIKVGISRQIANPHITLIGSDKYSNGAATEACARLYARAMKYVQPAQTSPKPHMMIPSNRVGMAQERNKKATLGCAPGISPTPIASGAMIIAAAR